MAWERRRGGLYYYRSRRESGRVVKEYVGAGSLGAAMAEFESLERANRQAQRDAVTAITDTIDFTSALLEHLGSHLDALAVGTLLAAGLHRHRGSWRRRRA